MRSLSASSGVKPGLVRAVVTLCVVSCAQLLFAADPTPAGAAPRGGGRMGRGGPLTVEDQAAIAKLAELPAWKAGAAASAYSHRPLPQGRCSNKR